MIVTREELRRFVNQMEASIKANPYTTIEVNPVSIRENGLVGGHSEFRRITYIECADQRIEVSSVGRIITRDGIKPVGPDDWYETMVWITAPHALQRGRDFTLDKYFRRVKDKEAFNEANEVHDSVVRDIATRLERGEFFKENIDYFDDQKD